MDLFYGTAAGDWQPPTLGDLPTLLAGINAPCRPRDAQAWSFELMLDEARGDEWIFRRQPTVTMSLAKAVRRTPDGIPYFAPEIQLLYKARNLRAKDQCDFERVLDRLGAAERVWLRDALSTTEPEHAWLTKLQS